MRLIASGAYNHTAVAGFFARVNWSYKDRYMFEANGRYDGSSRFVGDKKMGDSFLLFRRVGILPEKSFLPAWRIR